MKKAIIEYNQERVVITIPEEIYLINILCVQLRKTIGPMLNDKYYNEALDFVEAFFNQQFKVNFPKVDLKDVDVFIEEPPVGIKILNVFIKAVYLQH